MTVRVLTCRPTPIVILGSAEVGGDGQVAIKLLTLSAPTLKSAKCKRFFRTFIASSFFLLERYIETFFFF